MMRNRRRRRDEVDRTTEATTPGPVSRSGPVCEQDLRGATLVARKRNFSNRSLIAADRDQGVPWCGQTYTLALAVLWWLARYENGIVPDPPRPPSGRFAPSCGRRFTAHSALRLWVRRGQSNRLKLGATTTALWGSRLTGRRNFQGYHGKQVLIIADEAPGIPSGIWDAIAGTMAGGKVHVVMAGNPTIPSGAVFSTRSPASARIGTV